MGRYEKLNEKLFRKGLYNMLKKECCQDNHLHECDQTPVGNIMFKVNNRNNRARCEICSKLTIKTTERRHLRRSGVFIVNFEHISHFVLLLTLNR